MRSSASSPILSTLSLMYPSSPLYSTIKILTLLNGELDRQSVDLQLLVLFDEVRHDNAEESDEAFIESIREQEHPLQQVHGLSKS